MSSFRMSREELAEIVAAELYEWHLTLYINPGSVPLWGNVFDSEKARWLDQGRKIVSLIGPAIALDVLLEAKQIVVKPPPMPERFYEVAALDREAAHAERYAKGALESLLALRKRLTVGPWTDEQAPGLKAALGMLDQYIRSYGTPVTTAEENLNV